MSNRISEHHRAAIEILSGGLGEGMNDRNYQERVNVAIKASGYLRKTLADLYEDDQPKQEPSKQ